MPNRNALFVGATAPVATRYDLTTDDASVDFTTITQARLKAFYENDLAPQEWVCTTAPIPPDGAIQAGRVRLIRVHQTADLPAGSEGTVRVSPRLDLPAFTDPVRGDTRAIPVEREGT